MKTVIISDMPLSKGCITDWLKALRVNSYAPKSHFAVAALLEVKSSSQYYYFAGVNVEDLQHNRLGMHAEQSAIATAITCLGRGFYLERCWVMGGPMGTLAEDNAFLEKEVWPCGHCRQLLIPFCQSETRLHSVTLSGKLSSTKSITDLMPTTFSRDNLASADVLSGRHEGSSVSGNDHSRKMIVDCIHGHYSPSEWLTLLQALSPCLIDEAFCTTPNMTLMIRTSNGRCFPAVLCQDSAFLTTDPLFSALSMAVTSLGADKVIVSDILLYQDSEAVISHADFLSAAEWQTLSHFQSASGVEIHYYNRNGLQLSTTMSTCVDALFTALVSPLNTDTESANSL